MADFSTWSKSQPSGDSSIRLGDDQLRSDKSILEATLNEEHYFASTSAASAGIHRPGSARVYSGVSSAVSTTADAGRLMWDETNDWLRYLSNASIRDIPTRSSSATWTGDHLFTGIRLGNVPAGGIPYATSASSITGLAIGSEGAILRAGASAPAWTTATFPATAAQGSILHAATANAVSALALGTSGQFLKAGASTAAWASLAASDIASGTLGVARGGTGLAAVGSALQVLRTNAGATALEWANAGGDSVAVYNAADFSTATANTWNSVTFDSEEFDSNSLHNAASNTDRLTAATAGYYLVWWRWNCANAEGVSTNVDTRVLLNGGTALAQQDLAPASASETFGNSGSVGISLSATHYVSLQIDPNNNNRTFTGGRGGIQFGMTLLKQS